MSHRAFLALGSNVGRRARMLGAARRALIAFPEIRLVGCSAVVETAPVDVVDQPDFLNQVLAMDTALPPRGLLEACLEIERGLGRDRSAATRRGPRTIDIDVLLYDERSVAEDGLEIPHPRLGRRPFLLELCRAAGAPEAWLPRPEPRP